jgi:ATP phosphoribosyltransferase
LPWGSAAPGSVFAAPAASAWSVADLDGTRIATSYPGLLGTYLQRHGVSARLIKLDGAVESAVRLGVADAIADVVETGSTLKRAGLEVFGEPILASEAILIQPRGAQEPAGLGLLLRRLAGVMTARNYKMVDYNIVAEKLDAAAAITPGIDSPTVSPLARDGWFAVRAMIPAKQAPQIMDDLWEVGAEGILVTDIAACRL